MEKQTSKESNEHQGATGLQEGQPIFTFSMQMEPMPGFDPSQVDGHESIEPANQLLESLLTPPID